MPAAIQTTKRKFHKLLEGLTTSSSAPSTPSLPSAKRPRLTPSSRLANLPSRRVPLPPQQPTEILAPSPWSHAAFLARLKTFSSISHWSSKPATINEVAWSRRGWSCSQARSDFNTVVCQEGCHQRRVVCLRPPLKDKDGNIVPGTEDSSVEPDDDLVHTYEKLIDEAHGEGCVWRGQGNECKPDIYRLTIARPSVWQSGLRERYESFVVLGKKTPSKDDLSEAGNLQEIIELLPNNFFDGVLAHRRTQHDAENQASETPSEPHEVDHAALALALYGWRGTLDFPSSPYAVATCDACFRRLGLWLYTKVDGSEQEPMKLDLVQSHRDYCPWIDARSQCMTGGLQGRTASEVLQVLIKNHSTLHRTPNRSRPGTSHSQSGEHHGSSEADRQSSDDAVSEERKEEIAIEDKKRFAKLRELSRNMGLKRWRLKQANTS